LNAAPPRAAPTQRESDRRTRHREAAGAPSNDAAKANRRIDSAPIRAFFTSRDPSTRREKHPVHKFFLGSCTTPHKRFREAEIVCENAFAMLRSAA
jgi:hypothetical protein